MTLEEIRREKKVAEDAVQSILAKLAERTGLTPASVDFGFIDRTTMMDERQRLVVGPVTITLEGI